MSRPALTHPSAGTGTDTTRSTSTFINPDSPLRSSLGVRTCTTPATKAPLLSTPSSPTSNLPPPAPAKTARFDRSALHEHWTRLKRTTGIGPPGPLGTGTGSSSLEADELETHKGVRWGRRTTTSDDERARPRRFWARRWREEDVEMRSGVDSSEQVDKRRDVDEDEDDAEVDAVVVDNHFLSLDKSTQRSQSTHAHDDTGSPTGPTASASSDVAESRAMVLLRYRVWPVIERFFSLHFHDPVSEALYRKETFYTHKTLAFWASCFLLLNWVLAASLASQMPRQDKILLFGVVPLFTVPLPVFITFDWPRTRPWIYQAWLAGATWCWGWYNLMFMYLCGAYGQPSHFSCLQRDFIPLFYYVTALPAIAIFAMGQNRTVQTMMVVPFIVSAGVLIIPWRSTWIRNILNLIIYHAFVLYINWMRETADRRLYVLRDQLKTQYKQTQKAQISERKSSDSKRRLTSYIFHEVRVPLNTALLAAQNLAGTGAIQREHEIEFNALEGSLNMMSKVLNDVLDFNRMDSGRFETVSKPFAFHAVIRSMLVPLGLGASAKGLQLIVELDENIDVQARLAAYRAQARDMDFGEKRRSIDSTRRRAEEWVAQRMEGSEEDGIVMGDEMRLRQVVTNLASNACKFTEPGGRITLRTKLIMPERTSGDRRESTDRREDDRALEHIVVRIEVQDTGVGIGQRDMEEKRLFSAFMQTASGLRQGGKGTGLGLALVRHIVDLSGGRLGVKSKRAVGSTFWVELPLGVGRKAVAGMHATRARDAAVDAINFSGGWTADMDVPMSGLVIPASSSGDASTALSGAPATPLQGGSALRSIMEHGGVVELVPQLPMHASAEEGPIVATRTLSPVAASPARIGESSRVALADPTASRIVVPADRSGGDTPVVRSSPKPSAHRAMASETSLKSPVRSDGVKSDCLAPLRVLVVDDDALTRRLMTRMLTRLGCTVENAENGQVALDMLLAPLATPQSQRTQSSAGFPADGAPPSGTWDYTECKYDIVFLDNHMPVCSGVEVAKRLRQLDRRDFVVGVTGNALTEDQQEYLQAGANHVLTKPVLEKSIKAMLVLADERRKGHA